MHRNRIIYAAVMILVIAMGLLSRRLSIYLPGWVNAYLGDALWAAMVFVGFAFLFNRKKTSLIASIAALYCLLTECSQLIQTSWLNEIRDTMLGGLVLGYGFLWTDLAAYGIGIALCAVMEWKWKRGIN
ncbi:DUF2809 domain-containing protein [Metabacillus sp. 84]|uniref:ribosomal maturation YjgA family protein n=1 Tax=Metabacillus sp. 84 TaxID=3404705 RepID=UPI003CED69AD